MEPPIWLSTISNPRVLLVVAHFDKELSGYIKGRTWHPTQKIKATGDGKILFSMTASGKEEIKAWILGFGPKAKVIFPKTLRDEIEGDLSKALAQYKSVKGRI